MVPESKAMVQRGSPVRGPFCKKRKDAANFNRAIGEAMKIFRRFIDSIVGPVRKYLIELIILLFAFALFCVSMCGCGAVQTSVKGERTDKGFWVKQVGPGKTTVIEELPDGTKRTISTERPQVMRLYTPETIGGAATYLLERK